jgi:hypothetical protein
MKHYYKLLELIEEIKATTGINRGGYTYANAKISDGDVKKPQSWVRPTADQENKFIEENGWAAYGKWHLGIDANAEIEQDLLLLDKEQDNKNKQMYLLQLVSY